MLRSAFNAGLRHLLQNRAFAAISVGGLAIGLCAALLAGAVIRSQYTVDHDVPGYDRTYAALWVFAAPGLPPQYSTVSMLTLADEMRVRSPEVEAAARVLDDRNLVRVGDRSSREVVSWADPDAARALPMKTIAGDADQSLHTPDGVILSRAAARRWFGSDAPIGKTLTIDDHPMTVRAVLADPGPTLTHQPRDIIASGLASFSIISRAVAGEEVPNSGRFTTFVVVSGYTYVRLKPGTPASRLDEVTDTILPPQANNRNPQTVSPVQYVRIDRLNLHAGLHPGVAGRMALLGLLGAVVLLIAGVNFVNVLAARSVRRAREVAVRKIAGARRSVLVAQFLGESLLYALAAGLLALALAEWLLPHVNAFLDTESRLDFAREPGFLAAIAALTALFGVIAGAYPAVVVSGFRPAQVLSGSAAVAPGGVRLRQCLVALQFALMIALGICASVVHLQRRFALTEGLRVDGDQVLMVLDNDARFARDDAVRALPGVLAVVRSSVPFLGSSGYGRLRGISVAITQLRSGDPVSMNLILADMRLFDFYGVNPLAGSLPRIGDPDLPANLSEIVINESLMRKFGIGPPEKAIGTALPVAPPGRPGTPDRPTEVTVRAVVPDFSLGPVTETIPPQAYFENRAEAPLLNVRLKGRDIPETLAAIDAIWKRTGSAEPPQRFFLSDHMQRQYLGVLRQSQAFGLCALIAIGLSCLGLFALTAATAERRTREIGVRKALGAQTSAIVRLLLIQFTRPVLWAILLAWPVAAWLMHRWLQGFAYRIDLPLWIFPVAAATALVVALGTVTVHTLAVARTRPAVALRHE